MTDIARMLPWDSAHFGVPIGRLDAPKLDRDHGEKLAGWMTANAAACVYCMFAADDAESPRVAEAMGARFVDVRVTYGLEGVHHARRDTLPATRLATAADVPALEALAASAHMDSRFYFDARFDRARADELYRIWLRKSVEGSLADGAVTFDHEQAAAGYVTFSGPDKTGTPELGEIGLVAVAERARGRGAASALLQAALEELGKRGAKRFRVVTQGRNVAAQRLYQRAGFVTQEVAFWFHLWASIDPPTGIR